VKPSCDNFSHSSINDFGTSDETPFMEISSTLLKILLCPVTNKSLTYDKQNQELISEFAGLAYPIVDGIPMLLVDKARKISSNVQYMAKNNENFNKLEQKDKDIVANKSIEVA
jgi:uncharacterized protein YbaR (Trm112 family)